MKIIDLLKTLHFGTVPTVHRKVGTWVSRGSISIRRNPNDGHAKSLILSIEGLEFLKERAKLLKNCFAE